MRYSNSWWYPWCRLAEIRKHFLFAFGPRCLISALPVVTKSYANVLCFCVCLGSVSDSKLWFSRQLLFKWNVSTGFALLCGFWPMIRDCAQFKFLTGELTLAGGETARIARMPSSELFLLFLLWPPCWHLEAFHNDCKFSHLKKNLYSSQTHGLNCIAIFFQMKRTLFTSCPMNKWKCTDCQICCS